MSPQLIFFQLSTIARKLTTIALFTLLFGTLASSHLTFAATPESFQHQVSDGSTNLTVNFVRFSNRGPNFSVVLQQDDGSFQAFTPPAFNTYIGTLPNRPGAMATAVRLADDTIYYRVTFEDGTEWVFDGSTEILCDRDALGQCSPISTTTFPGFVIGNGGAGSVIYGVEVGVDLPFHRFSGNHNSDPANALAMIEYSIMSTNGLYLRETGIQHQLGLVVVRASQARDPYAQFRGQTSAGCQGGVLPQQCDLLNEVTNQWDNVINSTTHDMALVVNETGGAGLANVGVVANPRGYSSNDATALGDFSRVFRHEGGHNWSLNHYDGGAPEGGTVNSNNNLGRFSGPEQALVVGFRNQQIASFDNLNAAAVAIPPQAATDSVYASNVGTTIINVLANDHDANGESLSLVSVNSTSELGLGGSLALAPGLGANGTDAVVYTAANQSTITSAIDRFTYRIRDASGLESVGYAFVRIGDLGPDYSQNFNSFADGTRDLGDGSIMTDVWQSANPTVQVQSQALRLTPDELGQFGAFTVPKLNLEGGFQASFRFNISAASTPADGLVFNFGDPIPSSSASTLGGFNSGLAIEFNTFNQSGYVVRVNGTALSNGYVSNFNLVDAAWHDVTVRWQASGLLTLTVDGTIIFDSLATTGLTATADDMVAFSAKTIGLSELVLIDDVNVAAVAAANINVAPIVNVSNGAITVTDSNGVAGEQVALSGTANDSVGDLLNVEWLLNGQVVGSGTATVLTLPDGLSNITFRATDSGGLTASTAIAVTVQAPTGQLGWPSSFAGTSPDSSLSISISFNNIGFLNASDGRIYSCLKIYDSGAPSSLSGVPEFDIAFSVVDAAQGIIQVANTRPFNLAQALASDGQLPSCSGTFELTTSEYSDVLQVGSITYSVRFRVSDPSTLQMQLLEATLTN